MANALQPILLWTGSQAEDRLFRRILVQVLLICAVIGGIIPNVQLPLVESGAAMDTPPRLVRVIEDPIMPAMPTPAADQLGTQRPAMAPRPEASQPVVQKPVIASRPEPQEIADAKRQSVKASAAEISRQKAAQAGVLALSDALGELRSIAPKATAESSGSAAAASGLHTKRQKPSMLTAGVTQGSAGIDGGVAHQSVLGLTGLPAKGTDSRHDIGEGGEALPVTRSALVREPALARSEEEIQEILDRNKSAMYMIYNRALRGDPTLQGKLVMTITIAPSGRVTGCRIIDSELRSAFLEKQLTLLVEGIDFGRKPGVPVVTTKVPIEFFPQ